METSLHRQLKEVYADRGAQMEVRIGNYRIDVVRDHELIEIQHGSLAAIRDKVRKLLKEHAVRVVKPIIASRRLVKRRRKGGKIVDRRMSPKRGTVTDLFDELVYFCHVYPHPRLVLEVALVEIEEWRFPGHGRRRRRRRRDHQVEDQKLIRVQQSHVFRTAADLRSLLPPRMNSPFDTEQLAVAMGVERWFAQRVAYALRHTGSLSTVGKKGNAWLYEYAREAA